MIQVTGLSSQGPGRPSRVQGKVGVDAHKSQDGEGISTSYESGFLGQGVPGVRFRSTAQQEMGIQDV